MIERLQSEKGGVVLDMRYGPVIISTWEGSPSIELIDRYYRWSDAVAAAAMAEEQMLVHITELSRARVPGAAVRKRIIEHALANPALEVSLAHVLVVPERRLHTLVNSIARFVAPHIAQPELVFTASIEGALERSIELLWKARIPPPMGLRPEAYEVPQLELAPGA